MTLPVVAVLVCASGLMLTAQPPDHRDRINSGLVPVVITPAAAGALDLTLLDNGLAASGIVGPERDVPISLAVQVDISRRRTDEVQILQAVDDFVAGLTMSGPPIKAWAPRHVGVGVIRFDFPFYHLSDRGKSWDYVWRPPRVQADWMFASLGFRRGRRVLILISDFSGMGRGESVDDVERRISDDDLRERVHRDHGLLYVIGFEGADVNRQTAELAVDTGGRVQMLKPGENPNGLLGELAGEFRRQSVLYFRPGVADGRVHTLTLESRSSAVAPRARQRYVAFKDVPR